MKIIYQNKVIETNAVTLLDFIESQKLDTSHIIVEFNGKVYSNIADINLPLTPNSTLNIFKIVGGG